MLCLRRSRKPRTHRSTFTHPLIDLPCSIRSNPRGALSVQPITHPLVRFFGLIVFLTPSCRWICTTLFSNTSSSPMRLGVIRLALRLSGSKPRSSHPGVLPAVVRPLWHPSRNPKRLHPIDKLGRILRRHRFLTFKTLFAPEAPPLR